MGDVVQSSKSYLQNADEGSLYVNNGDDPSSYYSAAEQLTAKEKQEMDFREFEVNVAPHGSVSGDEPLDLTTEKGFIYKTEKGTYKAFVPDKGKLLTADGEFEPQIYRVQEFDTLGEASKKFGADGKFGNFQTSDPELKLKKKAELNEAFEIKSLIRDADGNVTHGNEEEYQQQEAELQANSEAYEQEFQDKLGAFGGQVFMLENIRQFVSFGASTRGGKQGYNLANSPKPSSPYGLKLLSVTNPELLMHFLISQRTKDLIAFQKGTPAMFSALIPQIRLFFVYKNGVEAEMPFSTYTESLSGMNPTKALLSRDGRGDDVGLVSFDWQFTGGKTGIVFADGKSGTGVADLSLYFQNINGIIRKRSVIDSESKQRTFSYDQLLSPNVSDHNLNEIKFSDVGRIRAVLQYGVEENIIKTIPDSKQFFEAAKRLAIGLSLAPDEYELEFEQSGGVIMTVRYQHVVETVINDPKLNVFGRKLEQTKKKLEEKLLSAQKAKDEQDLRDGSFIENITSPKDLTKNAANAIAYGKKIEQLEEEFRVSQNEVYGPLKKAILERCSEISIDRGSLQQYLALRQIKPSKRSSFNKSALDAGGVYHWNSEKIVNITKMRQADFSGGGDLSSPAGALRIADNGNVEMNWVYFGDLMDVIVQQPAVKEGLKKENLTIILGQIVIPEVLRGNDGTEADKLATMNLADLPISLHSWNQFFTKTIVTPKITNISFFSLVRKMISQLVLPILNNPDFLGHTFGTRTTNVGLEFYSCKRSKLKKLFGNTNRKVYEGTSGTSADLSLGTVADNIAVGRKKKANVCLIAGDFSSSAIGEQSRRGDEGEDAIFGIPHFYMASEKGPLKEAAFTKGSLPMSREIQYAASQDTKNTTKPKTMFWQPFSANMELFGSPTLYQNMIFFLNPTLPGSGGFKPGSAAYKLQIGGYHQVVELKNSISSTGWSTSVTGERLDMVKDIYGKKHKGKSIYPSEYLS